MRSLLVLRRYSLLVAAGAVVGAILVFWWLYQPSFKGGDFRLTPRTAGTYTVGVDAVIDTANFGIGRSDTDSYRLALMAPTYAQLMTSQSVLERAETILGRPITEQVTATAPNTVPIVHVAVEGPSPSHLASVAAAVVTATRDYVDSGQAMNDVPKEVKLTVRGMGMPSEPEFNSARNVEIAVLMFLLPLGVALAVAFRLDKTSPEIIEVQPVAIGPGDEDAAEPDEEHVIEFSYDIETLPDSLGKSADSGGSAKGTKG